MTTRTLFVHVGPVKTGTSAIQHLFRSGRVPGILYPKVGQWADGAHHVITCALYRLTTRGDVAIPPLADVVRDLVEEIDRSDGDVLISSEGLDPRSAGELIDLVTEQSRTGFAHTRIIAVARDPVERAASDYNQIVKDPAVGEKRSPDAFLETAAQRLQLMPNIEGWQGTGAEVTVLGYHPAEGLLARFLAVLGQPDANPEQIEWHNRSVGGKALLTLLMANRLLETHPERQAFFLRLREDPGFRIWRGASFPFSPEVLAATAPLFEQDRQAVAPLLAAGELPEAGSARRRFVLSAVEVAQMRRHLSTIPAFAEKEREFGELIAPYRL